MVDVVVARPAVTMAPGRPPPAVEIRKLNLVFDAGDTAVTALADVDLTVDPGDFVSPIGPSGCGKTTLERVMADLERASSGEVRVNGVSPDAARVARAYGYVFRAPALCLAHGCCATSPCRWRAWRWRRPSGSSARAACSSSSTSAASSANFSGSFPAACSSGCPSRALSVDPALLLRDEPFGALDEIVRESRICDEADVGMVSGSEETAPRFLSFRRNIDHGAQQHVYFDAIAGQRHEKALHAEIFPVGVRIQHRPLAIGRPVEFRRVDVLAQHHAVESGMDLVEIAAGHILTDEPYILRADQPVFEAQRVAGDIGHEDVRQQRRDSAGIDMLAPRQSRGGMNDEPVLVKRRDRRVPRIVLRRVDKG